MRNLNDLADQFGTTVEALREWFVRKGLSVPEPDEPLPDDLVVLLGETFRPSLMGRIRRGLKRLFSGKETKTEPVPEPEPENLSEGISVSDPDVPEASGGEAAGRESSAVPSEEERKEVPDEEPSFHESPTLVEPPSQNVPEPEDGIPVSPDRESEEEIEEPTPDSESADVSPPGEESLQQPDESLPVTGVVGEGEAPAREDPDLLMASLEQIEKVRESLPEGLSDEEPDFPEVAPELGEEPEEPALEQPSIVEPPGEEGVGSEPVSAEPAEAPTQEINSEELQSELDRLIESAGVAAEVEESEEIGPSLWQTVLGRIALFFAALSLKEKSLLAGSALVAATLFGTGIYVNQLNYGAGGDIRFYEEGVQNFRKGDLDGAEKAFSKVVERYPRSSFVPDAYFGWAKILRSKGDLIGADRTMRTGLRAQRARLSDVSSEWSQEDLRKRWEGFFFLGEVNAEREDWETSIEWFSRLLEETTDESLRQRTLYRLADAQYHKTLLEKAETEDLRTTIRSYEAALNASPEAVDVVNARLRIAETWERLADREKGFSQENLEKALEMYRLVEENPEKMERSGVDPLDVSLQIARLYRELGRIDESLDRYRQLLTAPRDEFEEGPLPHKVKFGYARSLLKKAEFLIEEGKRDSAQEVLSEVLETVKADEAHPFDDEELTEAVYLRGHAYFHLGRLHLAATNEIQNTYYKKMELAYQSALKRDPKHGKNGEDSLLAWMRRTNYLFQVNKNYRDAARAYKMILEEFPDNRYAYRARFRLAEAYFNLEEYEKAEEQYRLVVETFPQTRYTDDEAFRRSYFRLGYCRFLLKKYDEAAKTYKTLLGLINYEDSEEALKAWNLLAWSYYYQGKYDEAIAEFRAFLERYPDRDMDGRVRLSLGRFLLQRFDYEEARKQFRQVIREHPGSEMARWSRYLICESYLAEARIASEDEKKQILGEALGAAREIREIYPDEDRILSILGQIYFDLGDYERAARELEYYKYSARLKKPPAEYQFLLAEAYYRLENYTAAALNFSQIDLEELAREEQARALYLYAESLRLSDRPADAMEVYQQLLDEYPTTPFYDLASGHLEQVRWNLSKGL